jgi:hypothetical protein
VQSARLRVMNMNVFNRPALFVVEGKGTFPIDMLRHDVATPADAEAVESIQNIDNVKGIRQIKLRTGRYRYITPDRWASFGWSYVEEKTEYLG